MKVFFWTGPCLPRLAARALFFSQTEELGLSCQLSARVGELEQVISVKPHADAGSSFLKASWAHVRRPQRPLKPPLTRIEKSGNRAVLRHGTEDGRPLPIPEQVVGAITGRRSGRSQVLNGWHGDPRSWPLEQLFAHSVWACLYTSQTGFCITLAGYPKQGNLREANSRLRSRQQKANLPHCSRGHEL